MSHHSHPWQLRLEHCGFSHIEADWVGGNIHFNPYDCVDETSTIVLSSAWPEALRGVKRMAKIRRYCTVVAPQACRQWLSTLGWPSEQLHQTLHVDGLGITLEGYRPIDPLTPKEALYKGWETVKRPWRTISRVRAHQEIPHFAPQVVVVRFPSGRELLHLQCIFHRKQASDVENHWIERSKEATWVIVGADFEEHKHCATRFARLQAEHILLTDLVGDYRRQAGLPCALLTPLADDIIAQERLVQIFATQVTHRFDQVTLLA